MTKKSFYSSICLVIHQSFVRVSSRKTLKKFSAFRCVCMFLFGICCCAVFSGFGFWGSIRGRFLGLSQVRSPAIKMSIVKPIFGRFNVEKQESLLKLVILSVAALLGESTQVKPRLLKRWPDQSLLWMPLLETDMPSFWGPGWLNKPDEPRLQPYLLAFQYEPRTKPPSSHG